MKRDPIIALSITDHVREGTFQRALWPYFHALLHFGALPLALPLTDHTDIIDRLLDKVDGVLLTGGVDIHPSYYGEELNGTLEIAPLRDTFESLLVPRVVERDLPLLGICRGIQAMNVFCGGTLVQHIAVPHTNPHQVDIAGGILESLYGANTITVNNFHHQCVARLADGFIATAHHTGDGVIEAIERPASRFAVGVQWHPERDIANDDAARRLFERFVAACRN